jgi:hypothetical protein
MVAVQRCPVAWKFNNDHTRLGLAFLRFARAAAGEEASAILRESLAVGRDVFLVASGSLTSANTTQDPLESVRRV